MERWTLDGGGHTQSECLQACNLNEECMFASISTLGFCYMVDRCDEKTDLKVTRYKKIEKGKSKILEHHLHPT